MDNIWNTLKEYKGRRVFVTGHTGFKGSWLTSVLLLAGAEVAGLSREIPTQPSLFEILGLAKKVKHTIGDVSDLSLLQEKVANFDPHYIFHLAAQPLVRKSYQAPVETFQTNVMGTVNILEVAKGCKNLQAVINVTTDKVYFNREWNFEYRENDELGGVDPYAASKACSELVTAGYFNSFFKAGNTKIISARAGNIIGGGDWAEDRLVPDLMRAIAKKQELVIRSPDSVRPWQFVLDPILGYLILPLWTEKKHSGQAFNFAPNSTGQISVENLLTKFQEQIPQLNWKVVRSENATVHESKMLKLSTAKIEAELGWRPSCDIAATIRLTADWYKAFSNSQSDMVEFSKNQINKFMEMVKFVEVKS